MSEILKIGDQKYKTVKIGNQIWMTENLKVTHYRNGKAIPNVTDADVWGNLETGAYCSYENNETIADTYGYLYNWYAVVDSRSIAPAGWHVPTDAEWETLTDFLGGENNAGYHLKETGTDHWESPNTGATNESSFSALPGGQLFHYGDFDCLGSYAYFWSSTEYGSNGAWGRSLSYNYSDVHRLNHSKQLGYSVRLLKD